jgi:hypothetical protein
MEFNTTNIRRKNPINRNPLFYSEEDYLFELEIGQEYLQQDVNQTVILYQVDYENTNNDDIYHEAQKDNIRFKTPVEINVIYEIEPSELQAYDKSKGMGRFEKPGILKFGVYETELQAMNCDIKRGDYIAVQITPEKIGFWTVTDANSVNWDNKHTAYGYKPLWRTCICAPVDQNEFRGK